jgi:RND superfamily putative drug exporter
MWPPRRQGGNVNLETLGRWCYLRRRLVVASWLVLVAGVALLGHFEGGQVNNNLQLPNTESQRAFDVLKKNFPALAGDTATIAFRSTAGVTQPSVRLPMEQLFAYVATLPHVITVVSPYGPVPAISKDGRTAFATVQFNARATEVPKPVMFSIIDHANAVHVQGLDVEMGGESVRFAETQGPGQREGVGLVAAVIILLIAFGSAVAMGLPLLTAGFGILISFALLSLVANVMDINTFSSQIASMVGLGVGIDYALFIVSRYREGLAQGMDPEAATTRSISTAGRSVVLAGLTVVVALMAMVLAGVPFIDGFAVGPSIAVLIMVAASITLLPAVLGFIGRKIDALHVPIMRKHLETAPETRMAFRWSRGVQRHPWVVGASSLIALLALATPLLSLHLGWAGAGANPTSTSPRRAYDLVATGFGPGFNEPLVLVAQLPGAGRVDALAPLLERLPRVPGVALVTPPEMSPGGTVAVLTVVPAFAPQANGTNALITNLRHSVIPAATAGTGATVYVAGISPLFYDMAQVIGTRLPFLIGGVLALSFLLLMSVFRSVIVPLKAVVMNLLSIGAAYGAVVAVFQWGWLGSLAGIDRPGPIEAFVPIILFAILFGLSMDYEVFLLSRIREKYVRTGDNSEAVADGLASTARIITAAAAIMVTLFMSFVLGDERIIKEIGFGLAVAVFVDATLVRMLLVPATMELLGRANWWLPGWLDRVIPTLRVEGGETYGPERDLGPGARSLLTGDPKGLAHHSLWADRHSEQAPRKRGGLR